MSEPFIGQLMVLPYTFAPMGWLDCYGQPLPIAQYSALYSLLGLTFGGSSNVNFKLPDLRGRTVIGDSAGPGLSPHMLGEAAGTENVTLTTTQMPQHAHTITATSGQTGGFSATLQALPTYGSLAQPSGAGQYLAGGISTDGTDTAINIYYPATPKPSAQPVNLAGLTVSLQNVATGPAGSSFPVPNMQPYLTMKYVIAMEGIYPQRP